MSRNILVLYGGVSPEHEVSIVTALQIMHALRGADENPIPGYITKKGEWVLGDSSFLKPESYKDLEAIASRGKRIILSPDRTVHLLTKGLLGFGAANLDIDVVFPVFHGSQGEDGTIQGLLELANLPYVGCGVTADGAGIDKYISKRLAENIGLRVAPDVLLTPNLWKTQKSEVLKQIKTLGKIVFVKPVTLGSSIGITRATATNLEDAIEVAFKYATRVLVEAALDQPTEVNISIIGNDPYQVSVTEQPVSSGSVLSFEDKYLRQGSRTKGMASAKRIIPAPVSTKLIQEIEVSAEKFFRALGGKGIARIDFMVSGGKVYFNEINTLPGSLAFYLWAATKVDFSQLVKKLVDWAVEDWQSRQRLTTTFNSNILATFASGGAKGKA